MACDEKAGAIKWSAAVSSVTGCNRCHKMQRFACKEQVRQLLSCAKLLFLATGVCFISCFQQRYTTEAVCCHIFQLTDLNKSVRDQRRDHKQRFVGWGGAHPPAEARLRTSFVATFEKNKRLLKKGPKNNKVRGDSRAMGLLQSS